MASTSTSDPVSFLDLPSTSQQVSSVDILTPLRRPRSSVTGHYRTHSTHISEDLSEGQAQPRPPRRSIIRPSSSFSSMGFSFKDRVKEVKVKEQGRPRKMSESTKTEDTPVVRPVQSLRSITSPQIPSIDRPSSSHGMFTLHKSKGLKKKRSLASLLSAASESSNVRIVPITHSISSSPSLGSSPLGLLSPLTASPVEGQPNATADLGIQRPSRKPENTFVRKNTWLKRENMRVHPYPLEAPYMQAYDPILLENDRHTTHLLRRVNSTDSPTFHDFGRKTPLYTLDLGCGSGYWLLDVSHTWKNSQHTGFDLVDTLIPELRQQDNIQFVRGNFLKNPLPFADKSFDFVRMANLTLCIPYDKWEFVLSEVQRVLTIEGRLELIDDQIFFPYGPTPTAFPGASASSPMAPVKSDGGASLFDLDDDDLDDEGTVEGDSLEDGDSMDTESTLVSDGDTSASSHENAKLAPPLEEPHLSPNFTVSLSLDDPETPTSATTITTNDTSTTARPSPWSLEAAAARNMETVFEKMLNKKFGIHTRPSDFVVDIMKHVFGNGQKVKSCHLKLAPRDSITSAPNGSVISIGSGSGGSTEAGNEKEEKVAGDSVVGQMIKPWFSVDKVKDEKKRLKLEKKQAKAEGLTVTTSRSSEEKFTPATQVPPGISPKAAGRLGISEDTPRSTSPIPDKISAKAASRLGISEEPSKHRKVPSSKSADRFSIVSYDSESSEDTPKLSFPSLTLDIDAVPPADTVESKSSGESEATPLATPSAIPSAAENRLSAKAANRLGISYSELTAAAAGSTRRPQSSSSSLSTSSITLQSPGLLLWPTTYIPLSPVELEMHACKNIHTLLGCKPALAEFIKTYADEHGARLAEDDEFDQAIWDYECFRRRRFHWPSEAPEWDLTPPNDPSDQSTPRSAKSRTLAGSSFDPTAPRIISDSPHGRPYMCDELTHVRTFRVYEAVKTEDYSLASLPFPRSPAPTPPKA